MLQGDFTIWIVCSEQGFFISYIIHDLLQWFQKVTEAESLLAPKHRILSLWVLTMDVGVSLRLNTKIAVRRNSVRCWKKGATLSEDTGGYAVMTMARSRMFCIPTLVLTLHIRDAQCMRKVAGPQICRQSIYQSFLIVLAETLCYIRLWHWWRAVSSTWILTLFYPCVHSFRIRQQFF